MLRTWSFVVVVLGSGIASSVMAAEPLPGSAEFFERRIRPVLIERCYECHGNGQHKGGLSLESAEALKKGGDSGPAIEPGKPEESLLIEAIGHDGGMKMPPKQKLADREIADLTAWVRAGADWPAVTVAIPLGNLFDDDRETSLGDALATDEFKAVAEADDLGVERIVQGWGTETEVAPGIRFSFAPLGSGPQAHGAITNDGWDPQGGIRTTGQSAPGSLPKTEDGIGMHANALITFDLIEIRRAGGLPPDQGFTFKSDRAGLNDDVFGSATPSAHLAVIVTRAVPEGRAVTAVVNGQDVGVEVRDGVRHLTGELPAPLAANGKFVSFTVPVPGDAVSLTLVSTGAAKPDDNPINSDHTVFSGPRLEFATTNSTLSKLGRTDQSLKAYVVTEEQRKFWSFQPIRDPARPEVKNTAWVQRSLDPFVLAKMEAQGLTPVAPASKSSLIRRVTFDLTGLPPRPEDVDAFLVDTSSGAYEKLVDRLLASPQFGERWARMWLDVARYGEDQAHTFQARAYPQGYRYRDWVVQAFNSDLPYDRFVAEQIAGDQLEPLAEEGPYDRQVALGYFALGPVYYMDAGCAAKAMLDELDDRVDTLARGFLGLTVACARCHDHKFDPIPQTDYYALAGIFQSSAYKEAPLATADVIQQYEAAQAVVKQKEKEAADFVEAAGRRKAEGQVKQVSAYVLAAWKVRHPPTGETAKTGQIAKDAGIEEATLEKWVRFLTRTEKRELEPIKKGLALDPVDGQPPAELTSAIAAYQQQLNEIVAEREKLEQEHAAKVAAAPDNQKDKIGKPELPKEKAEILAVLFANRGPFAVQKDQAEKLLDEADKKQLAELRKAVETAKKASPPMYPQAHSLTDGSVANMKLHVRGNPTKTAGEVPRGFLSVLKSDQSQAFSTGSGRLDLARAIASPDNPLTARVIVNRIWQQHFGKGIVRTPSNFGQLGERPTHPDLLDHLAFQFMAHGWSLKWLHREIVLSATYQASASVDGLTAEQAASNRQKDPDNVWLWKANRRRLDVEAWRDAMLFVCGTLDLTLGGPSQELNNAANRRRTLYAKISRHNLDGLLRLFDFPDPNITSDQRTVTTVPLQQLFVLNSDFLVSQAKALSTRLKTMSETDADRIRTAYRLLYGRAAEEPEVALGVEFLSTAEPTGSGLSPWDQYAQALLAASEFAFVD